MGYLNIPVLSPKETQEFPNPQNALTSPNGLLAIGGSLSTEQLLLAYQSGVFPWFNQGDPILWWSPDPRCILFPDKFKLSRSLSKRLKQNFCISVDLQFEQVIRNCSYLRQKKEGTWITNEMIEAYIALFHQGYAHSIEVWFENVLVGGLYGICLGNAFFGESMFHFKPDASKIALYALCHLPVPHLFDFIDCQLATSHLISLGAKTMPRTEFLKLLQSTKEKTFQPENWSFDVISSINLQQ